jgi:hypothetical protein
VRVHHGRAEQLLPTFANERYGVAFFDGFAPTVEVIGALRALLCPGGVLIAGNLTMAPAAVDGELADAARWLTVSFGETALAVKRAVPAG